MHIFGKGNPCKNREHLNSSLKASTSAWRSPPLWSNSDTHWVTVPRLKQISTYVFGGWWWRCRWWGVLWWRRGPQSRWCLALDWTAGAPACCLPQGKYQLSLENRSKIHTRFICLLHWHVPHIVCFQFCHCITSLKYTSAKKNCFSESQSLHFWTTFGVFFQFKSFLR